MSYDKFYPVSGASLPVLYDDLHDYHVFRTYMIYPSLCLCIRRDQISNSKTFRQERVRACKLEQ
jgi:hypothetical protein